MVARVAILAVQRQILRTGHVPEKLCKTCAQGSPDKSQKMCAKDVRGHRQMCRDCAQFFGEDNEPKPKLFGPDIFQWGRGLPHEGVGAKKFSMPLETTEIKLFGGISRDFAGISWRCPKSLRKKSSCSIFWPLNLCGAAPAQFLQNVGVRLPRMCVHTFRAMFAKNPNFSLRPSSWKSKRGLGPEGANWAKKGLFGAISALPHGCEVRRNWSWSAPKRPRYTLERPQSAPKRPDFPGRTSPQFSLKNSGLSPRLWAPV